MPQDANTLIPSLWNTLTLPAPTNTWPLGSPTLAWSNLYLGPDPAPVFDPTSGNVGYYKRTAGEIAAGVTPVNYSYPPGWISRYGSNAVPGTTDMSAAMQNAVDSNKGGSIYIDSLCLVAGIKLTTSSYNGTEIRCIGSGELFFKQDTVGGIPQSNFDGSIWSGILLQNCDRVLLSLRWNGNRSNMSQREGIHCVDICGATNVYCQALHFREIRGDGLYIDHLTPSSSAALANSQNIVIDYLWAYNSADDGRNACSVISCDGLTIGEFHSFQVGGFVNSIQEPGGLDMEPNWANQSITDVVVGNLNVVTAGTSGLAVTGLAITNDATRDWNALRITVSNARVRLTAATGNVLIKRTRDVSVNVDVYRTTNRGFGVLVDYADRINLIMSAKFVTSGLVLGLLDFIFDCNITANINDYGTGGVGAIWSVGVGRTTIKGRINTAVAAVNALGIQLGRNGRGAFTQNYVVYSMEFPYDPNVNTAIYNGATTDQVTIGTGTIALNCVLAGWPFANQINFQIPSYNCAGRNVGSAITAAPASGTWAQFDEVSLDQSAGSTVPRVKCITGGSPGTWKSYGVLSV